MSKTIFHSIQCILRTIKIYLILFGLFDLMGSRLSDLISTAADRLTKHSSSTRGKRARWTPFAQTCRDDISGNSEPHSIVPQDLLQFAHPFFLN